MTPTHQGEAAPIVIVPARGDDRSIEVEYDPENRLVQFIQRGEEVFGTLEPIAPEEWAFIQVAFENAAGIGRQRRVLLLEARPGDDPIGNQFAEDVVQGSLALVADADEVFVFRGDEANAAKYRDRNLVFDSVAVAIQRQPIRTEDVDLGNMPAPNSALPQLTPDEARTLHAVYSGDAFDTEHLESAQPKLEAIAGEDWR